MIRINILMLFFIFCAWQSSSVFAAESLVMPVGVYNAEVISHPTPFDNGECPDPYQFPLHDNQILAELLLLCNALKLGGINVQFDFQSTTDYWRIINNAGDAKTLMPGFIVWKQDINPNLFYVSEPVLKKREFTKGLYTTLDNKKLLRLKSTDDMRAYSVATNPNWIHDNAEIECIGLKTIKGPFNPISMARMVAADRTDFLLFPFFNSPDLKGSLGDVYLVPMHGIKVAFNDSLHFIVSKNHPQGQRVFQALQKGLAILDTNGTVHYIYEQLGFFNPHVKNWVELGCKNTP